MKKRLCFLIVLLVVMIPFLVWTQEVSFKTLSDFSETVEGVKKATLSAINIGSIDSTEQMGGVEPGAFLYYLEKTKSEKRIPVRRYYPLKTDRDSALEREIVRVLRIMTGVPEPEVAPGATPPPELFDFSGFNIEQTGGPPQDFTVDLRATAEWIVFWAQVDAWEKMIEQRLFFTKQLENSYFDVWEKYAQERRPGTNRSTMKTGLKNLDWNVLIAIMVPDGKRVQEDLDALYDKQLAVRNKFAEARNQDNQLFYNRLDERAMKREKFYDWLADKERNILIFGEEYIHKAIGGEVIIDGTPFLISDKPLEDVPYDSVNIVTKEITPHDLFTDDGYLKKPNPEE